MHKAAIVILNYNGFGFLKQFLPNLLLYSKSYPIYVADNSSTDESVKFLEETYPQIFVIRHKENYGFCRGYNLALSQIASEYYILLNSDIEVTPNWVDPVISLMDKDLDIAACQPKIRAFQNAEYFEYAGAAGGFIDKWGYPFCRGRVFNTLEKDTGQYDTNIEVFWATGACFFVRASCYHQLKGLDDDFFAHMEEIDLCWRLKAKGYKIYYCSESTVFHVGGGTLPMNSPRKTYFNFRNGLYLLFKNLPKNKLWFVVSVRIFLDYLTIIKFALSGAFNNVGAVLRAHKSFFKEIRTLNDKRRENTVSTDYLKMKGLYNKSLFLNYFLLGKKTFDKLKF